MKKKEEICASFTVENEDHVLKEVVVTQDIISHYKKEDSYCKRFRLESLDGPVVYRTEDPDIFKLDNGTLLKKRKRNL